MSDLIDRKEAVEAVKNEMLSWLDGDSHDYRKVVDAIMDVPTVEVGCDGCDDGCPVYYEMLNKIQYLKEQCRNYERTVYKLSVALVERADMRGEQDG